MSTWFPSSFPSTPALISTDGDGKVSFDTDGSCFVERVWTCSYVNALALCPRPRSAASAPVTGVSNLKCINSSVERLKPDAAIVRATYQGTWRLPFTIYQMDASRYERPITYHPDFANAAKFGTYVGDTSGGEQTKLARKLEDPTGGSGGAYVFDKFRDIGTAAQIKFRGIEAYMVATATFRKTSYDIQPDFGLAGIFKLGAPETGGTAIPDPANTNRSWLKADKTCRNLYRGASEIWEIQESWLYNANGWLTEIYG